MSLFSSKRSLPTQANDLNSLQTELNKLMESFFSPGWKDFPTAFRSSKELANWSPNVNVSETDTEYKVRAELPGVDEKDIELSFRDNIFFIKGEKHFQYEDEKEDFHRVETGFGSFQRRIPFQAEIDSENVRAEFKNGLLTVSLKKKAAAQGQSARKINIQS